MAANPGEEYAVVAARIAQEFANYREFLRNPAPIGKIILNAKQLPGGPGGAEQAGQMYQVRDPAEGQATVEYSFNRSDRLVLEFIAYDKNDTPLYPIVRTYSDWIGKRKFNLGLGRVFVLKMTAGDLPELVRVQADFSSARAAETDDDEMLMATGGLARAAREAKGDDQSHEPTGMFNWLQGQKLALLLLSVNCLIFSISIIGVCAFSQVAVNHAPSATYAAAEVPAAYRVAVVVHLSDDTVKRLLLDEQWRRTQQPGRAAEFLHVSRQQLSGVQRAATFGALAITAKAGHADITYALCGKVISQCSDVRAPFKFLLDRVRGSWALRPYSLSRPAADQTLYDRLAMPTHADTSIDPLRVTFLPSDALLVVKGSGCFEYGAGAAGGFGDKATIVLASELMADILKTDESSDVQVKAGGAGAAAKGVSMTQSE
ncbi:MAG: hypothetical protein ACJ74W_03040 [Pyrinomonadaceae bacterium]